MTKPRSGPEWIIRPGADNYEIWLCGGCIDSLEALNDAEEFLSRMRPLMQAKEEASPPPPNPLEKTL